MPKVLVLNWKGVVQAFQKLGWTVARQRGSHIILVRDGSYVTLSIPKHRVVAQGTLRSLIRSAGITVEEFIQAEKT